MLSILSINTLLRVIFLFFGRNSFSTSPKLTRGKIVGLPCAQAKGFLHWLSSATNVRHLSLLNSSPNLMAPLQARELRTFLMVTGKVDELRPFDETQKWSWDLSKDTMRSSITDFRRCLSSDISRWMKQGGTALTTTVRLLSSVDDDCVWVWERQSSVMMSPRFSKRSWYL